MSKAQKNVDRYFFERNHAIRTMSQGQLTETQ